MSSSSSPSSLPVSGPETASEQTNATWGQFISSALFLAIVQNVHRRFTDKNALCTGE